MPSTICKEIIYPDTIDIISVGVRWVEQIVTYAVSDIKSENLVHKYTYTIILTISGYRMFTRE